VADQLRRLHPGRPGVLLGLAPGRTGACVRDWLGVQSDAFRREIAIVVIDPSAPYASGIRAALPGVTIAVDKWHLVDLANAMVTDHAADFCGRVTAEGEPSDALGRNPGQAGHLDDLADPGGLDVVGGDHGAQVRAGAAAGVHGACLQQGADLP
jgi:hypothetical protein